MVLRSADCARSIDSPRPALAHGCVALLSSSIVNWAEPALVHLRPSRRTTTRASSGPRRLPPRGPHLCRSDRHLPLVRRAIEAGLRGRAVAMSGRGRPPNESGIHHIIEETEMTSTTWLATITNRATLVALACGMLVGGSSAQGATFLWSPANQGILLETEGAQADREWRHRAGARLHGPIHRKHSQRLRPLSDRQWLSGPQDFRCRCS